MAEESKIKRRLPDHADDISFEMPRGFQQDRVKDKTRTEQTIARTFACYLLGVSAYSNSDYRRGPFWTSDRYWQLEGSNDYFLQFEDENRIRLWCRYPGQAPVLNAMATLFLARFGRRGL